MDMSVKSPSTFTPVENSTIAVSPRARFFATYNRHQPWSIPESVIYYIAKHPLSVKCYEKLIKSCKYFFVQNPFLVVPSLTFQNENLNGYDDNGKLIDLNDATSKLLVRDKLFMDKNTGADFAISKIYQCDAKNVTLWNRNISLNDFVFLASKCEKIWLKNVVVANKDDNVHQIDELFQLLPFIKDFTCQLGSHLPIMVSSKTFQDLLKIPQFLNLQNFSVFDIPESFDIDCFYNYMKKNKKTKICLHFRLDISQQYKERLQAIVDEILADKNRKYRPVCFDFFGIRQSAELHQLFHQYYVSSV